ncbi:MAG: PAS domain S-box protein, partial [Acidobacteria bacterium]|nr:PAS domain S-box protein [Acidobacteriota bacterium]
LIIDYILKPVDGQKLATFLSRDPRYGGIPRILLVSTEISPSHRLVADLVLTKSSVENLSIKVLAATTSLLAEQEFPVNIWETADKGKRMDDRVSAEINILRSRYETIFENDLIGLIELDGSNRILSVNERTEKIFSVNALDVIGKDIISLMKSSVTGFKQTLFEKAQKDRRIVLPIDDRFYELSIMSTPLIEDSPEKLMILADVTETEKLQKQLAKYTGELEDEVENRVAEIKLKNIELENLNRLKTEFLSNVSHEIRTPLASIKGFTETLLTRDINPETRKEFLDIIATESLRMERIVNDLLDITRIQQGNVKQSLNLQEFDMVSEAEFVKKLLTPLADEKKIELSVRTGKKPVKVTADKDRVRQVFINLIENGIKFSSQGTQVLIEVKKEGNEAVFMCSDRGIGIPASEKEKIFEKFYMIDGGDTRRQRGTGVGLFIASEIAKMHHGTLAVDGAYKNGSRLIFRLPLKQ